jgi:hypothetical protein
MTTTLTQTDSGTVTLRGIPVDINSDVGSAFTTDCVRFVENLVTEEQLKKKYDLDDEAWRKFADNVALQRAVGRQNELRILNGTAAKEKATHLLVQTIDIIGDIAKDAGCPPRSRIEASRELRQVAAVGGDDAPAAEKERFHITINFGAATKIVKEIESPKPEVIEHNIEEHEGD